MMADPEEIRAWLRKNGHEIGDRGRIPADKAALYEAAHDPVAASVTEADFDPLPPDEDPGAEVKDETQPTKPRASRARGSGLLSLRGKSSGGSKRARRKVYQRVPLNKFGERTWDLFARFARPVSQATSTCFSLQAPMAGVLLEDIFRDSVADRFLQPLARAEDKADKVIALAVPPVLVLAIEMTGANPRLSEEERVFRLNILFAMLEEALEISLEVTEQYAEQLVARQERKSRHREDVSAMIAMIFPPREPPSTVVEGEVVREPEMAGASA